MKLRLLKLVIQPAYVLDDGATLTERPGEPFAITEADLDAFPSRWRERFTEIAAQVEAPREEESDDAA